MTSFLDTDLYKIGAPIAGFVGGVLVMLFQRFTLTKKEKSDIKQKDFETTQRLMKDQSDTLQAFVDALAKYNNKTSPVEFEDFISISNAGEKYFYQQSITSSAILSGRVEDTARDSTFMPKLNDTVSRLLPAYYRTLQNIAQKKGFSYQGKLKREDYESIYRVVEKFGEGKPHK